MLSAEYKYWSFQGLISLARPGLVEIHIYVPGQGEGRVEKATRERKIGFDRNWLLRNLFLTTFHCLGGIMALLLFNVQTFFIIFTHGLRFFWWSGTRTVGPRRRVNPKQWFTTGNHLLVKNQDGTKGCSFRDTVPFIINLVQACRASRSRRLVEAELKIWLRGVASFSRLCAEADFLARPARLPSVLWSLCYVVDYDVMWSLEEDLSMSTWSQMRRECQRWTHISGSLWGAVQVSEKAQIRAPRKALSREHIDSTDCGESCLDLG